MLKTLLEIFGLIRDTRTPQGKRYDLPHFLLYCTLSVMAGASGYEGIRRVLEIKLELLNKTFGTKWKKAPSVGGIYKIIKGLDTKEFEEAFRLWALMEVQKQVSKDSLGNPKLVMAIDGKYLNGTNTNKDKKNVDNSVIGLISVFETVTDLILAHVKTDGKGNEMKAVEDLILELTLPHTTITMDALHTQKNAG